MRKFMTTDKKREKNNTPGESGARLHRQNGNDSFISVSDFPLPGFLSYFSCFSRLLAHICSPAPEKAGRWISRILSCSIRNRSFNIVKSIPFLLFHRSFWPSCSRKVQVPCLTSCRPQKVPSTPGMPIHQTASRIRIILSVLEWKPLLIAWRKPAVQLQTRKNGSNWPFRLIITEIPMPPGHSPITAAILRTTPWNFPRT